MPHAFELPRMLSAVVPLVCREGLACFGGVVVGEAVAFDGWPGRCCVFRFDTGLEPRLAAVVGSLQDLAEPAAGLRGIDAVRIHRRTFHVVDFPARKMGTADLPVLTFAVGSKNERAFARPNQNTHIV